MIRTSDGAMQRQFGVLFDAGSLGGWGDGALLDRFLAGRDDAAEAAFASLVERHGPMVLRVCRATLGDEHDAHDAFQATFLVLARKARSVRIRDTVGPWLHGVAWRVASRARAASYRRRRHERRAAEMAPRSFEESRRDDAEATLHEEVLRLPAGFREAVILCDLEGLTTDQAAERLGTPVGTVRSRLYRGRDRLRGRLLRRGIAPATVGMVVASGTASAVMVPAALAEATVGLAVGWCWAGTVPIRLAWLVNGGRYAMGMKSVAAVGLSLGLAAGVGGYAAQGPGRAAGHGPAIPVAGRAEPKRAETDAERLQGRWIVVDVQGPNASSPSPPPPEVISFRGDRMTIARQGKEDVISFAIDEAGDPKTIRALAAPGSRPEVLAYEIDGRKLRFIQDAADPRRVPSGLHTPVPERPLRAYSLIRDPASPTAAASGEGAPKTPPADPRSDHDRLQGRWTVLKIREGDKKPVAFPDGMARLTVQFQGDEIDIRGAGAGDEEAERGTFRIDPDAQPPAFRMTGMGKSPWVLYALEGDRLKLAFTQGDDPPRAKSFDDPGPDPEHPVAVWELAREAATPAVVTSRAGLAPDPSATDRERLQGRWTIVSARENGRESDEPSMLMSTMTFRGNELRLALRGKGDARYVFSIDPDSRPRAMLLAPPDPKDDRPQWCLYAFERNKLRLAFDMTMKRPGRPQAFDEKDAEHPICVFELVRDDRPPTAAPARAEADPPADAEPVAPASKLVATDHRRLQGTWSVIKASINGREFDGPGILFAPMTFRGNEVEFGPFGSPPVKNSYRFLIDPEGEPRALRVVREGGKPRWWLYSLKGDKLRTAAWQSIDDPRRPESFEDGGVGDPLIVLELVRNVVPDAPEGDRTSLRSNSPAARPELAPTAYATPEPVALPPSPAGATPDPGIVAGGEPGPIGLPTDSTVGTFTPAPGVPVPALTPAQTVGTFTPAPGVPVPALTPGSAVLPSPGAPAPEALAPSAEPGPPADAALPPPAGPALAPMPIQPGTPLETTEPVTPTPMAMAPVPTPAPQPLQVRPAPPPIRPGSDDLRRLQGTWSVLALEVSGGDHEPDPDSAVLFAGDAVVFVWGARSRNKPMMIEPGTFTLNNNHQPGWVDITPTSGGPPRQAIYKREGPLLLLSLSEPGRPRPTAFDTAPGSDELLFVLRRKRPGADPSHAATPSGLIGRDIHLQVEPPGSSPGQATQGLPARRRAPGPIGPGQQSLPAPIAMPAPAPSAAPAPAPSATPAPAPSATPTAAPSATPGPATSPGAS